MIYFCSVLHSPPHRLVHNTNTCLNSSIQTVNRKLINIESLGASESCPQEVSDSDSGECGKGKRLVECLKRWQKSRERKQKQHKFPK